MKSNTALVVTLTMLVVVAALYRVVGPVGYAPHLAMALFGGAVIKDRKWAFAFPIFSIFISDLLFHIFYINGLTSMQGFYEGQITNYLLFMGMTLIGFGMKRISVKNVVAFSLLICAVFFILSNFFVWVNGAGLSRPLTFSGLMQCYADAVPFLRNSVIGTLVFSGILFGGYRLIESRFKTLVHQ